MKVHDSQAYRKMDVTMERISCILELSEILLSFQTGFKLVNAAVVCTILESISGLEPSSVITESRLSLLHKSFFFYYYSSLSLASFPSFLFRSSSFIFVFLFFTCLLLLVATRVFLVCEASEV